MKDVFLIYDRCCFYEIVVLSYFMNFSKCDMVFCSLDGKPIKAMEGFSVNSDVALNAIDKEKIRSFIIPGGDISSINNVEIKNYLQELNSRNVLIAGICAGVDVLDDSGILRNVKSTHSTNADLVNAHNIITAKANAYVDFAIEVAKQLDLFTSEEDLQETIDFWKNYNRVQ